jgi:hypothetical protein
MTRAGAALAAVAVLAAAASHAASPADGRAAGWQRELERFGTVERGAGLPVRLKVSPGIEEQAAADRDSSFATYAIRHHAVEVHAAADAPREPDLVAPALASARFLAAYPGAERFGVLVAAYGAARAGTWWGRPPRQWAPMLRAAGLCPAAEDLARPSGQAGEPALLSVGAAASAIDLWVRQEGRAAVERALGSGDPPVGRIRAYLAAAAAVPHAPPARRPLPEGVLPGMTLAMANHAGGSYLSRRSASTLDRLRPDDVKAVALIPYAFQKSADSPEIRFPGRDPRGESEEAILRGALDARARGMAVLVKPQIWLWRGFTGEIAMRSDADWEAWFRAYREYVARFAVVAQAAGADLLDVGVELCAAEARERQWRDLITAVRALTGAPLVYSCNWGKGVDGVRFWDALDAIGVDFYDPLSASAGPTDSELAAGARAALRPLAAAAARTGKPVYLTEIGYPSVAGAWISPHDENSPRPYSAEDPARCARAVFAALEGAGWCRGLFWWKAFSDGRAAEAGVKTFNVVGRPIEGEIRKGFRRMRGDGTPERASGIR